MAQQSTFPRTYVNARVHTALDELTKAPTMEAFGVLLEAAVTGGLAVDTTGSTPDSGPTARTLPADSGGTVLPLFTSLAELKKAIARAGGKGTAVQAMILPAREALALVRADDCVAVQFNPGTHALVVARPHIEKLLDD